MGARCPSGRRLCAVRMYPRFLMESFTIMYAIVDINGIQTKVTPEEVLNVPLMTGEPGAKLTFDRVLLVGNGEKISLGQPTVKGASVAIEILEHLRGPKLRIFKFKRRRAYRRRKGHRDELTRIRVTAISA
jgi:large subunit ribosomal protein L21